MAEAGKLTSILWHRPTFWRNSGPRTGAVSNRMNALNDPFNSFFTHWHLANDQRNALYLARRLPCD
ncbi:hypothetical protein D7027_10745 [Ochrobactrum intermedium]|nr:hypothetical protein [Brucella intermedia]